MGETAEIDRANGREIMISIQKLNITFGTNHVLRDFNLTLYKGENIVVLGKSGSGKSVLIKCIIGLLKADSGKIEVLGQSIPELNSSELDHIRMKTGFLFQSNALYDSMTVRENLEFPLRRHGLKKKQIRSGFFSPRSLDKCWTSEYRKHDAG